MRTTIKGTINRQMNTQSTGLLSKKEFYLSMVLATLILLLFRSAPITSPTSLQLSERTISAAQIEKKQRQLYLLAKVDQKE